MFITKFTVGYVDRPHYKVVRKDDKIVFLKTDIPANGNILTIKCDLDYELLKNVVKFCYAFASEKNGRYPTEWIDPAIVNSYYEGLFTFDFKGEPQYLIDNTLRVIGQQESIINYVITYARGLDYFKQPVTLPKTSDFEIENESNQSNTNEKPKDVSTQGEGSKDSNLPLNTSNLTYMGKLYIAQDGNLILKKD